MGFGELLRDATKLAVSEPGSALLQERDVPLGMSRRRAVCDAADRADAAAANGQGLGPCLGRDDQFACMQARPHGGCRKDKAGCPIRSSASRATEIRKVGRAASSECRWDEADGLHTDVSAGRKTGFDDDGGAPPGPKAYTRPLTSSTAISAPPKRPNVRGATASPPSTTGARAAITRPRPRQSKAYSVAFPEAVVITSRRYPNEPTRSLRDARREGAGRKARERMTPAVAIHPQHAGRRARDEHEDVVTTERAARPSNRTAASEGDVRLSPRAQIALPPSSERDRHTAGGKQEQTSPGSEHESSVGARPDDVDDAGNAHQWPPGRNRRSRGTDPGHHGSEPERGSDAPSHVGRVGIPGAGARARRLEP